MRLWQPWPNNAGRRAHLPYGMSDVEIMKTPPGACSQRQKAWRAWRDSNPQPTDSKSGALSIELQAQKPYLTQVYHKYSQPQNTTGCEMPTGLGSALR